MIVTADHHFRERYSVLTEKSRELPSMRGYAPITSDYNCLEVQVYGYAQQKFALRTPRLRALGIYARFVEAVHEDACLTKRGLIIVD